MAKFWGSTHRCPVAAVRSRVGGLQGHSRHRRRGSRSNRDGMTTAGGQLGKGGPQKSIGFQSGRTSGIRAEGRNLPQFPTKANPGKASLLRSDKRCSGLSSTTFQVWSTCSAPRSPLPTQIIRGRAKEETQPSPAPAPLTGSLVTAISCACGGPAPEPSLGRRSGHADWAR